jgi:hypothetical protein
MVDVTVVIKRLDGNFFQQKTLIENAYRFSSTYLLNQGASAIFARGEVSDLDAHLVEIDFPNEFPSPPIETRFIVYKIVLQQDGTYAKKNIPWGYVDASQPSVTGFEILINEEFTPDLTGVIIQYVFDEK